MIKITVQNTAVLSAQMNGDIRPEVMALVYYLYNNDQENYRKFVDTVNIAVMIIDMENDYHAEDKEGKKNETKNSTAKRDQ